METKTSEAKSSGISGLNHSVHLVFTLAITVVALSQSSIFASHVNISFDEGVDMSHTAHAIYTANSGLVHNQSPIPLPDAEGLPIKVGWILAV